MEDEELELLHLAAKSIGKTGQYSNNVGGFSFGEPYSREERSWNPLFDDGDAFRLAADLSLDIQYDCYPNNMNATCRKAFRVRVWGFQWFKEDFDEGSKMGAIRRVIVQAAANIGRRM